MTNGLVTANQFQLVPEFSRLGTGFKQGQDIANQFQLAKMREQQAAQEAKLAPLRHQLMQQEVAAGQAAQQQAKTEKQKQERISNINKLSQAASIIKPYIEKDDILGASTQLESLSRILPPESIKELSDNLATGNLDEIRSQIQSIETLQAQVNIPATLEAQKLAIRERELEQRKEIIEGEAKRAGEKEAAKVKAKAEAEAEKADLIAATKAKITDAVEVAKIEAKSRGETLTELGQAKAALPSLINVVDQLKALAPIATSTFGGKAFDTVVKELGFGSTKGADARAKFVAIVDNQILPLLKQTFGAAFTAQEGEALKATLGDPDAAPSQKMTQLDAFIESKMREIEVKESSLQQDKPARTGGQIMVDANGNRAMVYPDGTFEEL